MKENTYKELLKEVDSGKKTVMITKLDKGVKFVITQEMLFENVPAPASTTVLDRCRKAIETGKLDFFKAEEDSFLIEPFFPEPKMIVFGGGHIAKPLVEFGARAGFAVTVIDDRPSFANSARFPDADKVICESFEKCFDLIDINEATFAVIVTRGHRHDSECLRRVLKHKTAYTGMIGSKRRVRGVMDQLLLEGFSKETLDNVNSPIGLEIGAVTPDEIAFSIIAELIKYRRIIYASRNNPAMKTNWPEFDRDVLRELTTKQEFSRSLVTIVDTKGSVPRKAGAKMLVWPRGEITGSIGGGCSEGAVIDNARYILRNRGWQLQRVDMTGDVAEDEGMVCGGIMDVVIEAF